MKVKIVYEDRDVLVIQKPAGLAAQTAKVGEPDVVSQLKNHLSPHCKGEPYLGIVHRLDQPVEGLLVFAKNKRAAASLTAQLDGGKGTGKKEAGAGTLNKYYYGVFCGKAQTKSGELADHMYKDSSGRAVIWEPGSGEKNARVKRALLQYRILQEQRVRDVDLSLAEIHVDTGRYHQIRAQMAHGGMCLLGDVKYADAFSREISQRLNIRNVALCAYYLEFLHPVTKEKMQFQIKPQGDIFSCFQLK